MTTEPILRYELKLACAAHWLPQARTWIRLHPEGFYVAYPSRTVNNAYLDTPAYDSFNANMAGVSNRRKLRLRWYGEPAPAGNKSCPVEPILELKYKENMLGGKKRFRLPVAVDLAQPWSCVRQILQAHAPAEWQNLLHQATQFTLINRYRRDYYVTPDGAVRLTLDYAQEAYDQRLALRPNLHARLPLDDLIVIEVKAGPGEEERLQALMGLFPASRSRNSKYVISLLAAFRTE